MNKEQFLTKLRKRLDILDTLEVNDIIDEYSGYFDEKSKKGLTEEEVIKEFGNFDLLVKEILSAYKINKDYEKSSFYNFNFAKIGEYVNEFFNSCKDIIQGISFNSINDIFKFIFQILLIMVIIGLLRLPVILIENVGSSLFNIFFSPLDSLLNGIWSLLVESVYLVISIFLFLNIFKRIYKKDNQEEVKEKPKKKNDNVEESKIVREKTNKSNIHIGRVLVDIIVAFLKIALILFSLPAFLTLIGFVIAIFINTALIITGVHYFGIWIILIACLTINILYIDFVFKFVSSSLVTLEKINFKKIFITFLISLLFLGLGATITTFEILDTKYIDQLPTLDITTKIAEYDVKNIRGDNSNISFKVVVDETLLNTFKVETKYYKDYLSVNINKTDYEYVISQSDNDNLKGIKLILNNLKNKEFYNYQLLYKPEVTIYISSKNIDKVLINYNNAY
ncbi:MAG: DUF1700 domain-containing protein [Bacilli bacterium]